MAISINLKKYGAANDENKKSTSNLSIDLSKYETPKRAEIITPSTAFNKPSRKMSAYDIVAESTKDLTNKINKVEADKKMAKSAIKAEQEKRENDRLAELNAKSANEPAWSRNISRGINKFLIKNPIGKSIDRFSKAGASASGIDVGGITPDTGSPFLNKALDIGGSIGGIISNPAKVPGGISAPYSAPITQTAANFIGNRISNQALSRLAQEATKEALTGGYFGATRSFLNDQVTPKELAKNIATDATLGAATGGVLRGLGEGYGVVRNSVNNAAENVLSNNLRRMSAIEKANNAPQYVGNLRLDNKSQNVSRIMDNIKGEVSTRMTPPLENEKLLREWVKPFLGNPSNKELSKLTYNDLLEIADEAKKGINTYDTALKVARERGADLERAFEQSPSIRSQVSQDASRRAYGITPNDLPSVERPIVRKPGESGVAPASAEPVKQHWWTSLFGDQGVGITPFGSRSPLSRNPLTTEQQIVRNPLKNSIEGTAAQGKALARAGYQSHVDMLSPLKNISKETYDTAMDAARANNIANTIVRDKFVDAEGNVIGDSLRDTLQKIGRGNDSKFKDYLVLRHAKTRMARGEKVYDKSLNMTPDKVQERINMYESRYPEFKNIGNEWDQFNDNTLQTWGVNEGLLSQGMKDLMREKNPNYASMRRQFTTAEKFANPLSKSNKSGFSGQKAPIKEVSPTGSTRRIVDPTRSAIESTNAWVNAALRNRTMQSIVRKIQNNPEAMKGIAEIVQPPKGQRSLKDILSDGGSEDFLESLNADFESLFKRGRLDSDNVVRAMVKGEPVYVKVHDPESVKALLGSGAEQSNLVLDFFSSLSNLTKRGATGALAPFFSVKSLTGDVIQSAMQAKNPMLHLAVDVPHAFLSSLADALKIPGLRNLAQDYRRVGGGYSGIMKDERALNKSVSGLTKQPLLSPQSIARGVVAPVKGAFKTLEGVADITENIPRMAAYRRSMVGKERTPENVRNAVNSSREATVNFSRKGSASKGIESFIPYHNAAIQSMHRFVKNWRRNPVKTAATLTVGILLPKLYEYSQFADDPDYQNLPARERYRNLIYAKNADGTFKKMKMPMEYESIGALFIDTLRKVKDKDPKAFRGTADAIASAFSPPIVGGALQGYTQGGGPKKSILGALNSTVIAPFSAISGNQSFTGAPIVPQRLQDESTKYQFDEKTSSIAKKIGQKIGMAPLQVDYLIRSYGGDPARLLLPLSSAYGGGEFKDTVLKNFIVDPVFTNNLSDDFYNAKQKFNNAKNDYSNHGDTLPAWYSEGLNKLVNSTSKGSITKKLSSLNELKRSVTGDKTLSASEKSNKIREIQQQINELYIDANSKLQDSGFKFPNR